MKGKLTSLHRSTDTGSNFGDSIADIMTMEPGEMTAEVVDATQYGTEHDWKESDYGLRDGGEWNFTIRYRENQTDVEALIDAFHNGTKEYVQVQFPAPISRGVDFRCLVTKVGFATPKEGQIDRTLTLKVDGPVNEGDLV
ncbi:hypothetical protein A6F57_19810 [Alteromonas stellipolaris]|uniref:phage tail tube protein n=1 Tax=Alteromonas stellipolaris TaxID=233316 RepID=UPI0007B44A59|nr:phage tail tube protein [Alteromonas stellipolaris]ANB27227.1 hypothetical protein A6F57_19810 [Alteromonas stellipolaris]